MEKSSTKLYIVATPLGNLSDITRRAIEIFKEINIFYAEDTREAKKLFQALAIDYSTKKFFSYANHNLKEATQFAVTQLESENIALITDRGTPGISDPGELLVREAIQHGVTVIPIPGASSITTLLSVSGLALRQFLFLGFLPHTNKERLATWELVKSKQLTICFLESPQRVRKTLEELKFFFGEGRLCVGRELTKLHEEILHLELSDLSVDKIKELGEFTIAFEPRLKFEEQSKNWQEELRKRLLPEKQWAKEVGELYGVSASELYNNLQKSKKVN